MFYFIFFHFHFYYLLLLSREWGRGESGARGRLPTFDTYF